MKRTLYALLSVLLLAACAACGGGSTEAEDVSVRAPLSVQSTGLTAGDELRVQLSDGVNTWNSNYITASNPYWQFPMTVTAGASYTIRILSQPANSFCTIGETVRTGNTNAGFTVNCTQSVAGTVYVSGLIDPASSIYLYMTVNGVTTRYSVTNGVSTLPAIPFGSTWSWQIAYFMSQTHVICDAMSPAPATGTKATTPPYLVVTCR